MASLADSALYAFLRLHDTVYRRTGGRVGHRLPGAAPSLLLHTVGARSGKPRTTTLSYARAGDDYLVVASKGGADDPPAWYLNLEADPEVQVQVRDEVFTAHARTATPEEHPALWAEMVGHWPDYDAYQAKTSREIPVVVLERA
jgi:deazaflavin-dependent oxidoreductase (nitroreductase family)